MSVTQYMLASTTEDYTKCVQFLDDHSVKHNELAHPTIMALRGDEVVALLSTISLRDAVVAGPMHVGVEGNPSFVLIRLVESYENILRLSHVTMYNFYVLKTDTAYLNAIEQISESWDIKQLYTDQSDRVWFERTL